MNIYVAKLFFHTPGVKLPHLSVTAQGYTRETNTLRCGCLYLNRQHWERTCDNAENWKCFLWRQFWLLVTMIVLCLVFCMCVFAPKINYCSFDLFLCFWLNDLIKTYYCNCCSRMLIYITSALEINKAMLILCNNNNNNDDNNNKFCFVLIRSWGQSTSTVKC